MATPGLAFPVIRASLRVRRDAEKEPVSGAAAAAGVGPRTTAKATAPGAQAAVLAVAGVVVGLGPARGAAPDTAGAAPPVEGRVAS